MTVGRLGAETVVSWVDVGIGKDSVSGGEVGIPVGAAVSVSVVVVLVDEFEDESSGPTKK